MCLSLSHTGSLGCRGCWGRSLLPDELMLQPCESSVGGSKGVGVSVKDQLEMEFSQSVQGSSPLCG